jgi:PAS domain S-box-containing protein
MGESLESLFRSDYMPHGHCYLWKPEILWLNVISDVLITFAYFSIPIAIYYFVKQRADLQFKGIFILFSLFILFCGITHAISIFVIWHGIYGIHGLAKLATAIVSCITAYKVFQSIPDALKLPTEDSLKAAYEKVNEERFERLKLEGKANEEAMLRESTNIAHVGVFAIDNDGRVVIANDAACQIFETTKAEIENIPIEELIEVNRITQNGGKKTWIRPANLKKLWQLQSDDKSQDKAIHIIYAMTQTGNRVPLSFKLTSNDSKDSTITGIAVAFASFQDMSEQLRYQQALAESEATTRSIIESLPIGMHIFKKNKNSFTLSGYNKAAERILALDHAPLLHQEIEEAFPDVGGTDLPRIYKNIAQKGGHWSNQAVDYEHGNIDGVFDVQCFQSVKNTAIILFEDVTEQIKAKKAIAAKELFIKTAFNASITGVIVYNFESNKIEFVNESFTDITGYSMDVALTMDEAAMADLIHPDDKLHALEHWQALKKLDTDAMAQINYRLKHNSGHWVWCLAKDLVFEKDVQGNVVRYMSSFLDISEMKAMQNNLIQLKESAESASAAKSSFLANMSHEIRTPMNAILGLTNVVLRMDLGAKQRDYLSRVEASSQSLLSLLNDILDYSKIEAGKLKINKEVFELNFVIDNCTGLFGFLAEQKAIEFVVSKETSLSKYYLGDPIRLSQIINNLLGNAVKFTSTGKIEMKVSRVVIDDVESLSFKITDSGIGMSQAQTELIFDAFSQADISISRQYGGTGLGLAISRSLTNLLGGTLTFETKLNEGSVFEVVLPFSPADYAGLSSVGSQANLAELPINGSAVFDIVEFEDVKALVVEDNMTNQVVAVEFLSQLNIQSVCVNNGLEAIKAVETDVFDFILMDLQMPVMDGYGASKVIKATPHGKHIPIIAMSAAVSESDIEKVAASGMDRHLPKPFSLPLLFQRLSEFLSHKKSNVSVLPSSQKWDLTKFPKNFNIADAMRKVGDDEGLYLKLIQSFADDFDHRASSVYDAFEQGQFDIIQRYAHTIKGLAESMGANVLHEEAKFIEHEYSQDNFVDPTQLFEKVDEAIASIRAVHTTKNHTIQPIVGGGRILALEYLATLRTDLSNSKFVAIDDITKELSAIAEFTDIGLIERFISELKKLEYKLCVSILDDIEAGMRKMN